MILNFYIAKDNSMDKKYTRKERNIQRRRLYSLWYNDDLNSYDEPEDDEGANKIDRQQLVAFCGVLKNTEVAICRSIIR